MDVTVRQDAHGVWYARVYMGRDAFGRQIRPYKRFEGAATREEAQDLANMWAAGLAADGRVHSARLVDLLSEYIDMRLRNGASPNSAKVWRTYTQNYVQTYIKGKTVDELTVIDLNRFEQALLKPKDDGGQGLCRNSVIGVHNFLRAAYTYFVAAGICDTNPMLSVAKPSHEHTEAISLDEWDFLTCEDAIEKALSPNGTDKESLRDAVCAFAAWVALHTGLRCGEVCALRLRDINRSGSFVHVGGTVIEERGRKPYRRNVTKGRKCRNVAITDHDIAVIDAFVSMRERSGVRLGADSPLVSTDGAYMRPSDVSGAFSAMRDRLGLSKRVTFHKLRHTHATWCLANGVDLKTLSERLGHADEATTLKFYAHVLPGRDAMAAQAFLGAAIRAKGGVAMSDE